MMETLYVTTKRYERVAIRIQRLYRMKVLQKAAKLSWKKKLAILTIQRTIRGKYARMYTNLMKQIMPVAASHIQRW
jgi:hypothetical protein